MINYTLSCSTEKGRRKKIKFLLDSDNIFQVKRRRRLGNEKEMITERAKSESFKIAAEPFFLSAASSCSFLAERRLWCSWWWWWWWWCSSSLLSTPFIFIIPPTLLVKQGYPSCVEYTRAIAERRPSKCSQRHNSLPYEKLIHTETKSMFQNLVEHPYSVLRYKKRILLSFSQTIILQLPLRWSIKRQLHHR